ncbi:hypothetical protein BJX99DRAFT_13582 [Aspergillus californicus]
MLLAALQYRKNKPESPPGQDQQESTSSRRSPSYHWVTDEDHGRAKDTLPEPPFSPEPIEATRPNLDNGRTQGPDTGHTGSPASPEPPKDKNGSSTNHRDSELLDLNGKLIEQQKDVSAKRLQIRELRTALRYKRDEESELRAKWIKQINSFLANLNERDAELMHGLEHLQHVTEDYLRMEDNYHREEDRLEEQEFMLDLSMEHFAALSGKGPMPDIQTHAGPWNAHAALKSRPELPRCVINYLSRIGEERMHQESLSELDAEWFMIMEKRDQRHHHHISLDEDSKEFLETFEEERLKIWKDLNNAQRDVNELRIICIEQGHRNFDYEDLSSLNPYQLGEQPLWEPEGDLLKLKAHEQFLYASETSSINQDEIDLDWDAPPMESPVFFRRLEKTKKLKSPEFINKWMLHQLRISSMGIWYLQRFRRWELFRRQGWQDHDIAERVLDVWFPDETVRASSSRTSYLYLEKTVIPDDTERQEKAKAPSMPSTLRPSAPKLGPRRHSLYEGKAFEKVIAVQENLTSSSKLSFLSSTDPTSLAF